MKVGERRGAEREGFIGTNFGIGIRWFEGLFTLKGFWDFLSFSSTIAENQNQRATPLENSITTTLKTTLHLKSIKAHQLNLST